MKEYYSTVEAAALCSVTRFSIINWIKTGKLKSCTTPGGHRRIFRGNLLAFIKTYGLGIDTIKDKVSVDEAGFVRCWEYHSSNKKIDSHSCKKCIVFLCDTKKCYTLRKEVGHKKIFCKNTCAKCEYYQKIHQHSKSSY